MPTTNPSTAVNAVLVRNSLATRCTLRRIWRPSATIGGTTAEASCTSTRAATERAVCVPEPRAVPRRAALRAPMSVTPSPGIPTERAPPGGARRPDGRAVGGDRGLGVIRCKRAGGAPDREHAPPLVRLRVRASREATICVGEPPRGAQHEPLVSQVERAPPPARGERHLF